jgi:hypothetical protein
MIRSLLLSSVLLTGCAGGNYYLLEENKTVPQETTPQIQAPEENHSKMTFGWVVWVMIIFVCLFLLVREKSKTATE